MIIIPSEQLHFHRTSFWNRELRSPLTFVNNAVGPRDLMDPANSITSA